MRGLLYLVLGSATACGAVNTTTPDGPPAGDAASAAPGDLVWVRSMSAAFGLGVADGPAGLIFSSYISAPTDFGGGTMIPLGAVDLALGDFKDADASYVYQVRINDADQGQVYGFLEHTDSVGDPLVYGVSYGNVDLGKGAVNGGGGAGADGFIGRYGPGAPAWVDRIVGPGEDKILATAPAPGGQIYAGGWFEQTTSWNGGSLTSAGGRDVFVASLNTFTGAVGATKQFGGAGRDEISAIAGDGTSLVLGGFFDDTLAMGGGAQPITASGGIGGPLDIFVAKLDADMAPVWAVRFGGAGEERNTQVALDAAGDIYVAGQFEDQVAFGAVNLSAVGMHDIFVAKLHGATGTVAWAVQLGGAGDDTPNRIIVDAAGHPVLSGSTSNAAVIASFDTATGAIRWQKMIATPGTSGSIAVCLGTTGDLYAVVNLGGAFDFGKPLIGPPAPASVVMRIAP